MKNLRQVWKNELMEKEMKEDTNLETDSVPGSGQDPLNVP